MTHSQSSSNSLRLAFELLILSCLILTPQRATAETLQLATFQVDVTPPAGERVGIGFIPRYEILEHPTLAKGIILQQNETTCVLCAIDYCGLCNDSYDLLRRTLAQAAGTSPDRVALQSLHQHTAPVLDSSAARLLYQNDPRTLARIINFEQQIARKLADAVQKSLKNKQSITHIATSRAQVERVASSRRLLQPDGSIRTRLSSTTDPQLRAAPEGHIDPWLRTVGFFSKNKPVAHLHYYATHPQSFYGEGRITWDVPGIAREKMQQQTGVFQVYLTACGGNIAMGKYNDGTPEARTELSERLYSAIQDSVKSLKKQPASKLSWQTAELQLPGTSQAAFSSEVNQKILNNEKATFSHRIKAAMILAWNAREVRRPVQASCLSIGPVRMIQLPGETFVEYQLFAQNKNPDLFVVVAAYSECGMWYIGPDQIYKDRGGYEQTWSFGGPVELELKQIIASFLK
ncbi:MAG: hypothetical protein RLO18_24490 [Gimesia chilikensis]